MVWEIDDQHATLTCDSFVGSFDLSNPQLGMAIRDPASAIELSKLFACLVPKASAETYVRGADLVSKYPPQTGDVSYNTYYCLSKTADGIDFILSAQTSLLNSDPLTQVASSFGSAEVFVRFENRSFEKVSDGQNFQPDSPPPLFLVRPATTNSVSWVLMLHPSDFYRAEATRDGTIAFWVFPDALEKGVIRRATFRARLVDRELDQIRAVDLLDSFKLALPPLAT